MKVVREHERVPTIEVMTPHVASVQALSDKLRIYNAKTTVQYYQ